jgi:DUF1680 family protein
MADRPAVEESWTDQGVVHTARSPHCRLRDVPLGAVKLEDGFWASRLRANREAGLPRLLALLEEHGVADNFRRLSGRSEAPRRGLLWTDSDLYKWMEAAAFTLATTDDAPLWRDLTALVVDVAAAQGDDGYVNTWFVDERAGQRFQDLPAAHELYCAGHLIQAAIAHFRATGERTLLSVAENFADYLAETFGPGEREGYGGHPEVEMAMVELYRTTGNSAYLDFTRFMLEQQGFARKEALAGHAVRAGYLCAGAADYYAETGDAQILAALERLWSDLASGKLYITGGVGSRHAGEAFGLPYELPNARAYAETCAAIASIFWNWRMLALDGEARFADVLETTLYNGFLSGVSLSATEYFYVNPLESAGGHRRVEWYDCTCCPTNVVRMLASVPGYLFSTSAEGLWVHLYENCQLEWRVPPLVRMVSDAGQAPGPAPPDVPVRVDVQTGYPWTGDVELTVRPDTRHSFSLYLRIPEWCPGAATRVNRGRKRTHRRGGSYVEIRREWENGDTVRLELEMPVVAVEANPAVRENRGCVALRRGPLVYCFESVDNQGFDLRDLELLLGSKGSSYGFHFRTARDLLGGVVVLRGQGLAPAPRLDRGPLYRPRGPKPRRALQERTVTAIPYYAWANRGPSEMLVWPRVGKARP